MNYVDSTLERPGAPDGGLGTELMYAPGESLFGKVAQGMVRLGWSVFPQERSDRRMPGRMRGEVIKWQSEHQLADHLPTPTALRDWVRECSTLNVAAVMGAGSGGAWALDMITSVNVV
jgi:hypothetical protein